MAALVLAAELPGASGGLALAASTAVSIARRDAADDQPAVLLVEAGGARSRGPTMLASEAARELEHALRDGGFESAARGRLAWLRIAAEAGWTDALADALRIAATARAAVVSLPAALLGEALGCGAIAPDAVLLRADLPRQRSLAALAAIELRQAGLRIRVAPRPIGRVGARRALAGIDPGGAASKRCGRLARGLLGSSRPSRSRPSSRLVAEAGQALPLVLGGVLALVFATLALAAFGGAVTGKSRAQRAADLAALSAARSMRDDFEGLFVPARRPDGSANPAHLDKQEYLARAAAAGADAANRNGVGQGRLRIEFPDRDSFAPLRVRAEIGAELDTPGALPRLPVGAHAVAEAVPAGTATAEQAPTMATGGGYAGPLVYRQGEGMRPDVAGAFDRMGAAARSDGLSLLITDGFRSDAEQAELWAENPDPRWVAPPGTSLHRCATELDIGPPAAYGWLAANAGRFGFVQRYWCELRRFFTGISSTLAGGPAPIHIGSWASLSASWSATSWSVGMGSPASCHAL